jgi:hypothetical protein
MQRMGICTCCSGAFILGSWARDALLLVLATHAGTVLLHCRDTLAGKNVNTFHVHIMEVAARDAQLGAKILQRNSTVSMQVLSSTVGMHCCNTEGLAAPWRVPLSCSAHLQQRPWQVQHIFWNCPMLQSSVLPRALGSTQTNAISWMSSTMLGPGRA